IEIDGGIDADERRAAAALDDAHRLHRSADRAGLARVRVNEHLAVRDALLDVIDLRFDGGEVVLRAALKNELATERRETRDLNDVLPNVLRQDLRETREHLLFGEAFLLEVDAIGVEEDGATVAELRRELRFERDVGKLLDWNAERIGSRLKQRAVAGRARV